MNTDSNQHQPKDTPANRFANHFWSRAKQLADDDPKAGTDFMFKLWDDLVEVGETLAAMAEAEDFDSMESAQQLANSILEKYQ